MKKTKVIIPALGMLLLSTAASITGTVAWFSANTSVTASGMNIQATTGGSYLVVNEVLADENPNKYDITASSMVLSPDSGTGLKLVTPLNVASNVDYYADASAAEAGTTTTPTKFTNAATVLWGTASSSLPSQVQASNVTTKVAAGDLADYVQTSELFFKVLPGNTGANLKCTKVTFAAGTNSIAASGRVLLVSESGAYQLFKLVNGDVNAAETGSDAALEATVTTTPVKITCFFYFDGTDAAAYTNNATDLSNVTANFTFAID